MVAAEQAADLSRGVGGFCVKERFVHGPPSRQWAFLCVMHIYNVMVQLY
jgi:hypothetical protein